ncbi:SDR family NAD(P)-dependent oxidoreductase, partial [Pseudoalteromonas carrageenovora]|uniref:SDR family NAD(P)-dependent oxidoreductase n=1 Tax=Pseudoalteromonas carrageenovora TaxID=227 RepID=UPI00311E03C7
MSKVAIVRGGTKGIGLAVVKRFIESGFTVHNLDIEPSEFVEFHQCDVSNVRAVQTCINTI